jgi:hypothetical protein
VLLVLLADVSDCGTVLLLPAAALPLELGLALEFGVVALGFDGFDCWSVCGVVLWLGVLGVVEGC